MTTPPAVGAEGVHLVGPRAVGAEGAHLAGPRAVGAERVRAAGRPAAEAQTDFRALLNALARPGTLERLAPTQGPPALAVAGGLADVEVPTVVLGDEAWAQALHLATSAPVAPIETARMVVALRPPTPAELAAMPRGDALHPEYGTRLILAATTLTAESRSTDPTARLDGLAAESAAVLDGPPKDLDGPAEGRVWLALRGPGVPGVRRIAVGGVPAQVFSALAQANSDFPAGIDTFLVAADGTVAGLPRSVQIGEH